MKKAFFLLLALTVFASSAFAAGTGGEPYRKCQAKIWSKPFICGGEALYKKLGNGTATQAEIDAYTSCNLEESQNCCDKYKPGTTWNRNAFACVK